MYKDLKRAFVAIEQTVCFFVFLFVFSVCLFVCFVVFVFVFVFFAVVVIVLFLSKTDCKIGPGNADTVLKWQG